MRINRAADDAAGLAISKTMRSQIYGLNRSSRKAQDGISLLQTAEGAMSEVHSVLHRMRELAVQSANGTYTAQDRSSIQKEILQLISEVDRISDTINFNNKNLVDGSAAALVSSTNQTTKVFVNSGLQSVDLFGRSISASGSYQLREQMFLEVRF